MRVEDVIRRPLVTEKSQAKKDAELTLCLEVAPGANKSQIRTAVERIFKVHVQSVRTMNFDGKLRRRGRFSGHRPAWKKAYVTLKPGQKMPEYAEV